MTLSILISRAQKRVKASNEVTVAPQRVKASDAYKELSDQIEAKLQEFRVQFHPATSFSQSRLIHFNWDDGDDVKRALESVFSGETPKALTNIGGDEYVEFNKDDRYLVRVNYADAYIIIVNL